MYIPNIFAQTETPSLKEDPFIHQCDVHEHHQKTMDQNVRYREANEEIQQFYIETMHRLRQNIDPNGVRSATLHTIPVVVHVMHLPGTEVGVDENLSMDVIEQGISDLNNAFRNTGAYSLNGHNPNIPSVDVEVEFCLATTDPNGNPTNGVNRISTSLSNLFRDDASATTTCINGVGRKDGELKELSYWDANDYMNIWLVNEICKLSADGSTSSNCGVAGYAFLAGAHGACFDGIVNEARFFGSSTSSSTVHIHEVGHYLNLRHTWGTGSSPDCTNLDCLNNGDFVCDTPPDGSTTGVSCGDPANTCSSDEDDTSVNNPYRPVGSGGLGDQDDLYENYMDYSFSSCQNTYTQGQKDRMRTALTGSRASLLASMGCDIAATNVAYFFDGGSAEQEANATTASGCRSFYDVNIEVRLYKSAASSTTVNFSMDGSSTAADGADIELNSTSITFNPGETSKNISVRIYDDAAIESNEVGIINITGVSGGAVAATFNQSHRVSIIDNDNAPSGSRPVLFSDDFESGIGQWSSGNLNPYSGPNDWFVGTAASCMTGNSVYISNDGGTTNNYTDDQGFAGKWLQTVVDATGYTGLRLDFDYLIGDETGRIVTDDGSIALFGSVTNNQACPTPNSASFDFSSFDNEASLRFGFWMTTTNDGTPSGTGFTVDNVELTADATDIESTATSTSSEYLGPNAEVFFLSADGELIARIQNLSSHDYGCTTISVDTDGSGSFNGGSADFSSFDFTDKTVTITPTTNNPSGTFEITLYYSETEIAGWETAASDARGNLYMMKSSAALASADASNSDLDAPTTGIFTAGTSYGFTAQFDTGFSTFGLTNTPPSALPVELTAFDGRKVNEQTVLNWTTATEINSDHFVVERSVNGTDFIELGKVSAAGNSVVEQRYDFIDAEPRLGVNYYRLIQVDVDGSFDVFGPINVYFNKPGDAKIFPIPTYSGNIKLEYDAVLNGELNWEVIDIQGKTIRTGILNVSKGINQFQMKDLFLNDGIYFMKLTQDEWSETHRFIIMN